MSILADCNVADFLLDGKDADRIALRLLNGDYSYGQLRRAATLIARHLAAVGSLPGERALLIADNGLFWVSAYLGILKAGMVAVPLPPAVSANHLAYIRQLTGAKVAFVQIDALVRHAQSFAGIHVVSDSPAPLAPTVTSECSFTELDTGKDPSALPRSPHTGDELAAIMFTSGSTGEPRGVMISHANIVANTESIIAYLALTETDRIMAVLPFHYCFGASLLHTHLRVGASVVVDSRFMYPEVVLDRMVHTRCTWFAGVPTHFQILLRCSGFRKRSFSDLRGIQQAGGCLAKPFLADLRQVLPHVQIFVMYGQTEATSRLSYLAPEYLETKLGSVGKAIPGVCLRVLNQRGEDVRPGEVGEIVAMGPNVAQGYWCAPHETAGTFRGGQLYTGDLATVDEEGFLYIVDRAKDFLKCRGERLSCRHLEEILMECEDVLEAAVLGIPDDIQGEAVKAFVVPREVDARGISERLLLFCRKRLPLHLVPKQVEVLPTLPRNSAGKVAKAILRNL